MQTMKRIMLTLVVLLTTMLFKNVSAQSSHGSNGETIAIERVDTAALWCVIMENYEKTEKELRECMYPHEEKMLLSLLSKARNNEKVESEQEQALLNRVFENFRSHPVVEYTPKTAIFAAAMLGVNSSSIVKTTKTLSDKEVAKLKKKVDKGIVSKELAYEIEKDRSLCEQKLTELNDLSSEVRSAYSELDRLAWARTPNDYEEREKSLVRSIEAGKYSFIKKVPYKTVTIDRLQFYNVDGKNKEVNMYSWLWLKINSFSDWQNKIIEKETKGWEWANDKYKLQSVNKSYPVRIDYYASEAHPEYAVKEEAIFTTDGKLVRVKTCLSSSDAIRNAQWMMYREDYEANKYNIKSKPAKTQEYLKAELGISSKGLDKAKKDTKEFFSEFYKATGAEMRMRVANMSGDKKAYKKAKQDYKKSTDAAANSFFGMMIGNIDDDGYRFIEQLKKDHYNLCAHGAYYIERVDDVTFHLKYISPETQETLTYEVTFVQTKPFEVASKVKLVDREHVSFRMSDFEKE